MHRLLLLLGLAAVACSFAVEAPLRPRHDVDAGEKRRDKAQPLGELAPIDCWPELNISAPIKCYYMHAPLDHFNESDHRTARLAVVGYPAGGGKTKKEDILGTLFVGVGGPGQSGVNTFEDGSYTAPGLDLRFGGRYNVMAWDPRGVGLSTPTADCYRSEKQRENGESGDPYQDSSESNAIGYSKARLWANLCAEHPTLADELRFVGTKSSAMDLRLLYRAAKDKALNLLAYSYGTAVGITFADTYPDEVGKMVLDGVMDVFGLRSGHLSEGVRSGQDVWEKGFLGECVKAGELCSLNSLAKGRPLKDVVEEWIDGLIQHPIISTTTNTTLLTYTVLKAALLDTLFEPTAWSAMSKALADAMKGDPKFFITSRVDQGDTGSVQSGKSPMAFTAIAAADALSLKGDKWTLQDHEEVIRVVEKTSPFLGRYWARDTNVVQAWKIQGKGQHTGNFTSKTRTPILFIGIDYDVATALYHARRMATLFPNAALLRVKAFGHTSKSQESKCAAKVIDAYVMNGTVPPRGQIQSDGMVEGGEICDVDRSAYNFTGLKFIPFGGDGKPIFIPPGGLPGLPE